MPNAFCSSKHHWESHSAAQATDWGGCTFPLPLLSSIACAEIQLREFGGGGGYIFVMKFAAVHSGYKHIFGSGTKLTVRAGKVL